MASKKDPKKGNEKDKNEDDKEKKADDKDKSEKDKENKENKPRPEDGGAGDYNVVTDFIEDVWKVMTPEMAERLRCVLTEDYGLSKKDADNFLRSQREIRKQRICLPKDKRVVRIGIRNQWIKELSKDIADPIASFLVNMLLSNRTPRAKKLTEKILARLCEITGEKCTVKSAKSKIQRMLVVIADRMATYFDEALAAMEKEMAEMYGPPPPLEDWEIESTATVESTETYTPSEYEKDEYDLDKLSESELEKLIDQQEKKAREEKKPRQKVSIQEEGQVISEEEDLASEKESEKDEDAEGGSEGSEAKEESGEGDEDEGDEDDEDEDEEEGSAGAEVEEEADEEEDVEEDEEEKEEEEPEEDEEAEEEEKVEEEEEEQAEEVEEEEEEAEEEGEEGMEEEGEEGEEGEEDEGTAKRLRQHMDILELMKEDIEETPQAKDKTERQRVLKDIIEKKLEDLAKDKLNKSIDTIIKFDVDEAASTVANWLEKLLPPGDIEALAAKVSYVPPIPQKQGSAFEVTDEGTQFELRKLSSTTVAKEAAEAKGFDFPARKKKLPRSLSPINAQSAKEWVDWAELALNEGEEWGKWLDKAFEDVEKHLTDKAAEKDKDKSKDKESPEEENPEDQKDWKEALEHEAQKWRAEKRQIKGEGYLWNKKLDSVNKPVGPEKETKVVNY